MEKIAIMGGTFDPIHYGHLVTAKKVKTKLNLDRVVFVPSGNPPHKKSFPVTSGEHRWNMLQLALRETDFNADFEVSDMELKRDGYSYALDTVEEFYSVYGSFIDLYYITGYDAIAEISTWYKARELMEKCKFIAVSRPGYSFRRNKELLAEYTSRIIPFEDVSLAISSSEIRHRVRDGKSLKHWVPGLVEDYILEHNLYKETEI